jgi:hypothetical protein
MKYNADGNLVNKMGDAPLHNCWYQWVMPGPDSTAELRRSQEAVTCALLRHLLTWNVYVDNLHKTDGNTPLHIAARLGPVKAVVILLGFQADQSIRNRNGHTALDIAVSHNQRDTVKVLSNWHVMKKQAQHEDFSILWKRFIADHEINMSNDPDAKTTIYKLHMRESVNKMNKLQGDDYMIDDPLIQRARSEGIAADQEIPLKPWEKKYQAARAKKVRGVSHLMPKGKYIGEDAPTLPTPPASRPGTTATDRPGTATEGSAPPPPSRGELATVGRSKSEGSALNIRLKRREVTNLYSYLINENRPQSSVGVASVPPGPVVDDGGSLGGGDSIPRPMDTDTPTDFEDEDEGEGEGEGEGPIGDLVPTRVGSAIAQRRLLSAHRIARDAKFELCTVRPCTSSALMLSRRSAAAPLFGTEEQKLLGRFLTSRNIDRPTSPPRLMDLTGEKGPGKVKENFNRPPVTPMGAYRPTTGGVDEVYSENEKIYKRLQSKDFYAAKRKAEATMDSLSDVMGGGAVKKNEARGTMVPMVNNRARSIETRVVPPLKIMSHTDKLNQEADAVKADAVKAAEEEEQKQLDLVLEHGRGNKKKGEQKQASPPKKPAIKYGANRLTSAEMTTLPIQNPWSTVSATYKVNMPV